MSQEFEFEIDKDLLEFAKRQKQPKREIIDENRFMHELFLMREFWVQKYNEAVNNLNAINHTLIRVQEAQSMGLGIDYMLDSDGVLYTKVKKKGEMGFTANAKHNK